MDFVNRLGEVLTSTCCNYASRSDNEDVMVMLTKKLTDESRKRKWIYRADLVKSEGRAEYADFISFVRKAAERINNRYGQELTSSSSTERGKKKSGKAKADYPLRVTKLDTFTEEDQQGSYMPTTVLLKCTQCSGPYGVWKCRIFRISSLRGRLKTVGQHRLCRVCFSESHSAEQCTKGFTCAKPGCGKNHHHLIHSDEVEDKGSGIKAKGRDASRSSESNGTSGGIVADPRSVPGSIATKIGSRNPPRVCNNTVSPSGHVTVAVLIAGQTRLYFKVSQLKLVVTLVPKR